LINDLMTLMKNLIHWHNVWVMLVYKYRY
jgi:hypothetical protein